MSETSTVPALLDDPAYALALDAGHTAAAAGHWLAAATRFGDALRAAAPTGVGLPPLAPVAAAVALTNLGQALARAGCWTDAAEMLRRSAEARDALVASGLADGAVAARGWSDLAALLAAAGPEDEARDTMARAHAATPTIDDSAVLAALAETRSLLGEEPLVDDARGPELPATSPTALTEHPRETAPTLDTLDLADAFDLASSPADELALQLDLADSEPAATATPEADTVGDHAPDLAALLALAAGQPEPELEPVELDGDDSLTDALDAAVLSVLSVPDDAPGTHASASAAASVPHASAALAGLELMAMDDGATPFPGSTPSPTAERSAPARGGQIVFDELDADAYDDAPVVLTPGVDLTEQRDARASAQGGGRGARLAAVDAVVQLTEAASPPARTGGLRGLLRRLLGR